MTTLISYDPSNFNVDSALLSMNPIHQETNDQHVKIMLEQSAVEMVGREEKHNGIHYFVWPMNSKDDADNSDNSDNSDNATYQSDVDKLRAEISGATCSMTYRDDVLRFHSEFACGLLRVSCIYEGNAKLESTPLLIKIMFTPENKECTEVLKLRVFQESVKADVREFPVAQEAREVLGLARLTSVQLIDLLVDTILRLSPFRNKACPSIRDVPDVSNVPVVMM